VANWLEVDPDAGLSSREADRRRLEGGSNELVQHSRPSSWRHVVTQFRDPLVALLLFAIVVSLAAWILDGADGVPYDAVAISAIVVLNAAIGAIQASRAETAVAALRRMSATQARVIRSGELRQIEARDVVVGDVLVVDTGDSVAADGRLLTSASLRLSEASLTGESEPVEKGSSPVDVSASVGDRHSMVHAGTAVVAGRGRALVVATGMDTEVGSIAALLGETERKQGQLIGMAIASQLASGVSEYLISEDRLSLAVLLSDLVQKGVFESAAIYGADNSLVAMAGDPTDFLSQVYTVEIPYQDSIAGYVRITLSEERLFPDNSESIFWILLLNLMLFLGTGLYASRIAPLLVRPILSDNQRKAEESAVGSNGNPI
jgi:Ca2+-transporting ATPase